MLKIAQCTDSFLPIHDGAGRVSYEYARALALRGHECYVIAPLVNTGFRGTLPFEIVDFMSVNVPVVQQRAGIAALDMHYLSRVDAIPFDIVHTHSPGAAGMEAARLSDKNRAPLVGTFHPSFYQEYLSETDEKRHTLNEMYLFDYFNRCDEIWTVSEAARELLLTQGFAGNIEVFDNGTETARATNADIAAVRALYHLSDAPMLLIVGRLDRLKNLPRILTAAAILRQRDVPFQLVFAGRGPDEADARARAIALGLSAQTRFTGYVAEPEKLRALYAAASLCLFPLQNIGAGLVIYEAAAQGTPSLVIAGTAPSNAVISGVNGVTCGDTPESMADAIEALLSSPDDAARIGSNARETLPVPWETVTDRVEARYEALRSVDKSQLKRKRGLFRHELQQMDQSLEKRTLDLIIKFLKQDTQHLYAYPYRALPAPLDVKREESHLPVSSPEAQGVSSRRLAAFLDALNADEEAAIHGVMALRHGTCICSAAWAPYRADTPHQLYSLSKSITATAVGMLADEGLLDLDEKLDEIFYDKAPDAPDHPIHALTVRNLLNMSTGSLYNEVGTALGSDWEKEFMQAGVKFPAGTQFDYNSMNTYMLAAIVRRKTGLTLTEYLTPRLYLPLGIPVPAWELCPNGTEKGGWGLSLSLESVAKIGLLYLNMGRWRVDGEEKQLLSEAWIREATRPQIDTPNGEITHGYGHQIWMTAHPGAFLFNGAFGQNMLALPDKDALIVLFAGTPRLFAQGGVLEYADACFADAADAPLPPDPAAEEALRVTAGALSARLRAPYYDPTREPLPFSEVLERLDGQVYTMDKNTAGLLPVILSNVENNYGTGIAQLVFRRTGDALSVGFAEGAAFHTLVIPAEGYAACSVRQRDDVYAVRVNAQTETLKTGEWMLHVNAHFIETPFTRVLHLLFRGDGLTLVLDETPSVKDASAMLMELAGLTHMQVFRTLLPVLKRDKLQSTLRTFTTMSVQGRLL